MRTFALLLCTAAVVLAGERELSVFDIPGTHYRLTVPKGFHPDKPHSGPRMDFSAWHFTNTIGSKLSIVLDSHSDRVGTKTNFFGFAALEQRQPMKRVLSLDSRGFTHEELEIAQHAPTYDLDLIYGAKNEEDAIALDQALMSFRLQPKKHSNHGLESTGAPPAAGTPETHP